MKQELLDVYAQVKMEIPLIMERIERQEKRLRKIHEMGVVKDTVSGGEGGVQHFVIEGMPVRDIDFLETQIQRNKFILQCRINRSLELMNQVEEVISMIPDKYVLARVVGDFHIIDGLSWDETARAIEKKWGGIYTPDQCRMAWTRAYEKIKDKAPASVEVEKARIKGNA